MTFFTCMNKNTTHTKEQTSTGPITDGIQLDAFWNGSSKDTAKHIQDNVNNNIVICFFIIYTRYRIFNSTFGAQYWPTHTHVSSCKLSLLKRNNTSKGSVFVAAATLKCRNVRKHRVCCTTRFVTHDIIALLLGG